MLVLNQYFWPGVEATAQLLTELTEALADEYDVTVVTGSAENGAASGLPRPAGVEIIRVPSTTFDRRHLWLRAMNYSTYLAALVGRALLARRPTLVLCLTDPPFLGAAAYLIARRFGAPLVVVSQDVFPDIAVQVGKIQNPVVVRVFDRLVRFSLQRANRVVAIGETMRLRLEAKGVESDRLRVIPNWIDTKAVHPIERKNGWASGHDLTDRFVVMHSGNIGHAQDLDTLVGAATFLRDLERLEIVIIGSGARHGELVALAERLEASQVRFLPYQPRAVLAHSLSSADIHVVGLASRLSGLVVPSRIYGVLAVGRPVIVAADAACETAQLVQEVGCGVVVPPGKPRQLAEAIRSAYAGELDLAEMGRRAREYAVAQADRRVAVARYRQVLREVQRA